MKVTRIADENVLVEFDYPDEHSYLSRAITRPLSIFTRADCPT